MHEPLLAYREGSRPLKKMLRARRIFASSYIHHFVRERYYGMAIKVAIFAILKAVADTLNSVFGIASMRNRLVPLTGSEQSIWQVLWHELEAGSEGENR